MDAQTDIAVEPSKGRPLPQWALKIDEREEIIANALPEDIDIRRFLKFVRLFNQISLHSTPTYGYFKHIALLLLNCEVAAISRTAFKVYCSVPHTCLLPIHPRSLFEPAIIIPSSKRPQEKRKLRK